jgi:ABC-type multidrug transport system fused ATPase/permease subunit
MHKSIQNKILSFLDKDLKHKSIKLFILMILAALAELFSLSLLLVILNFFLSSNFETHYGSILIILENLPFFEEENLLIYFLGIFFFIFTLKITILIIYSWVESKFLAEFKQKISDSLFKNFLYRDTFELLKKNSSEYLRNFTSEIEQTTHFYNSLFKLTLDLIVLFAIFSFLVFFNPIISISVAGIFLALSFSYLFFVKNLILDWGIKSLKSKKLVIQYISDGFSAIKYIKMLSREEYFYKKFVSDIAVLA